MANAWGELSWNAGNWGDQNNVTISVTGFDNSIALNSVDSYPNQGWGSDFWGIENWGLSGNVATLTGLNLTIDSGERESWGELGWNASTTEWGGPYLTPVAIGQQINVSGQQQNLSLNSPNIDIAVEVFLNQNPLPNLTIVEGTVDPAPDVMLTGIGLTTSLGIADAYNEQGWGRDDWGTEVWGAEGIWNVVDVSGQQLNLSLASINIRVDVDVQLTTTYDPGWGNITAWGEQTWGQATEESVLAIPVPPEVEVDPDTSLVGQQLNISLENVIVTANANVSITGIALEIAQGQAELDAVTFVVLTGQELETALNSAVAGASAEVFPTGNELTIGLGSINIQSWQIVNTGSSVNWNIIDTAA
jgi:hypothetical protein